MIKPQKLLSFLKTWQTIHWNGNNLEWMLKEIKKDGFLLQYVSPTLKNDKTLVLEAVKQNGLALKYASEELKDNKTIVEMAIKQNHKAFVFCSQSLQNHRDFVLQQVQRNGLILEDIHGSLLLDLEIVLEAVYQNEEALAYATTVMYTQIKKDCSSTGIISFSQAIFKLLEPYRNQREAMALKGEKPNFMISYKKQRL